MAKLKRKLKGKNVARLKKDDRKKREKTLKRMDKIRNDDSIRLRTKIENKIKFHQAEVLQADNFIKEQSQKIESVRIAKLRIEGALISLKDILNNANDAASKS